MKHIKPYLLICCLFLCLQNIDAQDNSNGVYGDIIFTPLMSYTILENGSNIPTSFLIANGVKSNLGFEIGYLYNILTTSNEANFFITAGFSKHILGFKYGDSLIKIGETKISNHQHARYFFGIKAIPFKEKKFFSISFTAGTGRVATNLGDKNINGRIKARTNDYSISIAVGLNKLFF